MYSQRPEKLMGCGSNLSEMTNYLMMNVKAQRLGTSTRKRLSAFRGKINLAH
jgi:hypothetical protein